jgi:hypothetical protein
MQISRACRPASVQPAPLVSTRQSEPFLTCGFDTAEPHIRSPLVAASTKIPRTRGHRARKCGTNLYRGILQPGRYPVRSPRSRKGQLLSRMAGNSLTLRARSGRFQHSPLRHFALCHVAPERDQQLAGQRDNRDPPDPPALISHTRRKPGAQRAARLMPHP